MPVLWPFLNAAWIQDQKDTCKQSQQAQEKGERQKKEEVQEGQEKEKERTVVKLQNCICISSFYGHWFMTLPSWLWSDQWLRYLVCGSLGWCPKALIALWLWFATGVGEPFSHWLMLWAGSSSSSSSTDSDLCDDVDSKKVKQWPGLRCYVVLLGMGFSLHHLQCLWLCIMQVWPKLWAFHTV